MENINNRCLPLLKAQFTPATSIYESYFFFYLLMKKISLFIHSGQYVLSSCTRIFKQKYYLIGVMESGEIIPLPLSP